MFSKQRESHDRVMWRSIARSLKLGEQQVASALNLRDEHLAKLEKIFIQRQTLNLEAIQHLVGLMLAGDSIQCSVFSCHLIRAAVRQCPRHWDA